MDWSVVESYENLEMEMIVLCLVIRDGFVGMVSIGSYLFDMFQDLDTFMGILILVLTLYFTKWDIFGLMKSTIW